MPVRRGGPRSSDAAIAGSALSSPTIECHAGVFIERVRAGGTDELEDIADLCVIRPPAGGADVAVDHEVDGDQAGDRIPRSNRVAAAHRAVLRQAGTGDIEVERCCVRAHPAVRTGR